MYGRGAVLSDDGVYRYRLWRIWDDDRAPTAFLMLNPSTADATVDDPTLRRCIAFARRWGAGGGVVREGLAAVVEAAAEEYGQRYKPRARHAAMLRLAAWVEWMAAHGVSRASQVTSAVLSAWTAALSASGRKGARSNATVNRALVVVRVCLRWAAARTPPLCAPTPAEHLRPLREVDRRPHPVIPSPAEWRRLVVALESAPCPADCATETSRARHAVNARGLAVLVAVAVSTGLRLDELRHLRPEDVAGERVEVRAHGAWSPKSWGERTIPVGPETRELARELAAWIASTPRGVNGIALDLGGHWIASGIDAAWARAGLPGEAPRMHDARRTYATESVRLGVTLDRVRGLLGHRDVSTTERYLGRYRSDAAEVAVDVGVSGALASGAERAKVLPMRRKENG
jgi:hypothetical protein